MTSNLEYYKVFYYVAKLSSVTKAAQELSISQPAVSQAMKQLESILQTVLFVRTPKGVKLTQTGELLFSYVEKGYEQIELGERKLSQMLNLQLGEIKIGASDMTLRFFLLPYLERFHEECPDIKISVTNAPTPETLRLLSEGKIDFGVVSRPFTPAKSVNAVSVHETEDVFIAGRRFLPYKNRMLNFQDLENLPMIFLEKNTSTRRYMDEFLAENGVSLNPEFELATSDMIVQFCLRSLGVGCVVKEFAQKEIESGRLFELRFNKMIPKRSFCVVTDRNQMQSVAAKRLLGMIYELGEVSDSSEARESSSDS